MGRERFDQNSPYSPGTYGGVAATQDHWGGNGPVADAQGNVTGTVVQGTPSGEQADVSRYRDIGEEMQKRDPYKFDWSQTDQDHSLAGQSAKAQDDANEAWRMQATGQDRTSFNYGKTLLDRGAQNQQGAAASTTGGPLAQVGANARAQNARAGFMQKGTQELEAQHADEMAAGRQGYAAGLAGTRKLDTQAQGLSDQATELQANAEAQQNKLNDAGQYGMEKMGVDVEGQAVAARQHAAATSDKMRQDQQAASDAKTARTMGTFNSGLATVGNAFAPGAGTAAVAGGTAAQSASGDDPTSDERAKDKQPNALLSMLKKAPSISGAASGDEERNLQSDYLGEKGAKDDDSPEQQLQKEYVSGQPKQAGEPKSDQQTPANLFSSKQKPLLASIDKSENQSISLPSDEIDANYKLAHQQPAAAGTAPDITGYDRGMFKRNSQDDGGDLGTDALHKGIESKIAHSNKMRTDYDFDQQADAQRARDSHSKNRVGTVGDVTGRGPEATYDLGFGKGTNNERGLAPGTRDYMKYGDIEGGPDAASKDLAHMQNARRTMTMDDFSKDVMTSDERAKDKVETPEEKKAREDKQDAEDTASFMKDVKPGAITVKRPETYEEATKAIDERNAQDKQIQENRKKANEDQAKSYMTNQDAELTRRNNMDKWLPNFVRRWSNQKIEERAKNRTPDQNIEQAVSRDKRDVERRATEHQYDQSGPAPLRKFVEDVNVATARPRQPTSFTRGDNSEATLEAQGKADQIAFDREHQPSDERAKNRGLAADKGAGGGEKESDGTTLEHRGPALTEATPVPSNSPRGVPQGGETRENDRTSITRSNPLIDMQKDANRKLRGETYTYKEGFGEDTNQLHHGFMAQNLEKNPITATAVREDPTGIKKVDNEDALRVTAAGVSSLQEQHDELEAAVEALAARRGKKRVA